MKDIITVFKDFITSNNLNQLLIDLIKIEKENSLEPLMIRFDGSPVLYTIANIEIDLKSTTHRNYSFLLDSIHSGIDNNSIEIQ